MKLDDVESVFYKDFMSMRAERIETMKKIEANISSFIKRAEAKRDLIINKLEGVKAVPTDDRRGAVVLDPLGKLFSIVKFEPLDDETIHPITYMLRMEPPYIPHFFLTVAYVYLAKGLIPSTLIRTEPVVSLISLLVKGDVLTAIASWMASGPYLLKGFITGEASVFPYIPSLLNLPVKADTLYLTNLGFSTEPSEKLGLNIKLDLTELPNIPEDVLSKLNFRSYRSVLDEVLDEVLP